MVANSALEPYYTAFLHLTGIGFTMNLFIGTLAFDDDAVLTQVRVGVLAGSILAGAVAALILGLAARSGRDRRERLHTPEPTP